jgi:hypothetical protein
VGDAAFEYINVFKHHVNVRFFFDAARLSRLLTYTSGGDWRSDAG